MGNKHRFLTEYNKEHMDGIKQNQNDLTEHGHIHQQESGHMYTHTHTHMHNGHTHTHTHAHSLISAIHSNRQNEWDEPKRNVVADDEQTALNRAEFEKSPTDKDAIMGLANSLCHQMRYNDAMEFFDLAVKLYPDDFSVHRRRGFCSMALLDIATAREEFEWCESRTDDLLDVRYRLGCCAYYEGEYGLAREYFLSCYELAKGNGPMHVAVVYWHILCCVRLGIDVKGALDLYDATLDAGHHVGYLATIETFADNAVKPLSVIGDDQLNSAIYYFGLSCYYAYVGDNEKARQTEQKALLYDAYFSSFAYIGLYCDVVKNNKAFIDK